MGSVIGRFAFFILGISLFLWSLQFFPPKTNESDIRWGFKNGTITPIESKYDRYFFGEDENNYYLLDIDTNETFHEPKWKQQSCKGFDPFNTETWCTLKDWGIKE